MSNFIVDSSILAEEDISLADATKRLLAPFIGSFKATTAPILDNDGRTTHVWPVIIHQVGKESDKGVAIDCVAAVVDCYDDLTVKALESAFERTRAVKALRKTDRHSTNAGDVHMTASFIVARRSELTLEQISSEMDRLNATMPSHNWPDAVAVLSQGMVNYTAQMPFAKANNGDFLLPAATIVDRAPVPSVYVQKVIRAMGDRTICKVISLVMVRAAIFQMDAGVQDYRALLTEISPYGAMTTAYQFNLAGVLIQMTTEQAVLARLPKDTFNVVSGKKVLGSVQFHEWQDGGVFVVRGGFPMDLFLVFAKGIIGGLTKEDMQYFRGAGTQVSYVLPMKNTQFMQTLAALSQRSKNMSVQRETAKRLIQQVGNEGSASPFVARLMIGVMHVRDAVYYDDAARRKFDELYDPLLTALRSSRETSLDIVKEWESHRSRIESGAVVKIRGRHVYISESINRSLRRDLESLLNTAVRAIKHALQSLADELGMSIGFLFQKDAAFNTAVREVAKTEPVLADYLRAVRQWSEPLVLTRNDLEHGTIPSPEVSYDLESSPVTAKEPLFQGKPITEYASEVVSRINCFVEEMVVFILRKRLPVGFEITEVPLADRDPNAPLRFHVTVTPGGRQRWVLSAHTKKFDEA